MDSFKIYNRWSDDYGHSTNVDLDNFKIFVINMGMKWNKNSYSMALYSDNFRLDSNISLHDSATVFE